MLIGQKSITQLTAAGNAVAIEMGSIQPAHAEVEVTIATIDTSVTLKIEYSNDNFSTTACTQLLTAITANAVLGYGMLLGYKYARLVFVSEVGGTGVTVDAIYRLFD